MQAWSILLASRDHPHLSVAGTPERASGAGVAGAARDPLAETLRRAGTLSPRGRIGAVISESGDSWRRGALKELAAENVFAQPRHRGTAYEVLFALLRLEGRVEGSTALVFLPSDHVVSNEEVMTHSLANLVEWCGIEPRRVHLLGAVPEGPHDELGYIVPWHDARHIPAGVYEFVEKPDVRQARRLINGGGLWNTFIFGGTLDAMLELFRPNFDAAVKAMRAALQEGAGGRNGAATLRAIYDKLTPADFSQDLLVRKMDSLSVLRMPNCGWWPLKSPKRGSLHTLHGI